VLYMDKTASGKVLWMETYENLRYTANQLKQWRQQQQQSNRHASTRSLEVSNVDAQATSTMAATCAQNVLHR